MSKNRSSIEIVSDDDYGCTYLTVRVEDRAATVFIDLDFSDIHSIQARIAERTSYEDVTPWITDKQYSALYDIAHLYGDALTAQQRGYVYRTAERILDNASKIYR